MGWGWGFWGLRFRVQDFGLRVYLPTCGAEVRGGPPPARPAVVASRVAGVLRAVELRVAPHVAEAVFVEEAAARLGRKGVFEALFAVLLHALLEVVHLAPGGV